MVPPRTLRWAIASFALGAAGCHTSNAGVHAIVTIDAPDAGGWAPIAFDHITVTATSSSHLAVVCLFPRAEGQKAVVVPSPSAADPDPCADRHDNAYAGVNTVYPAGSIYDDWDLVTLPWTLNFDSLSSGDLVSVDARGIFGGAAAIGAPVGVMDVKGSARANPSYPNVTLAFPLPPSDNFWGAAGEHCAQGDSLDTYTDLPTFSSVSGQASACPRTEPRAAHSPAITPLATAGGEIGRVPVVVASGCDGGEPDGVIFWKSETIPLDAGCVEVELDGRFAACDPSDPGDGGPCKTSVRCVPPATDLTVLAGGTAGGQVLAAQNISCIPTYPEAVGYVLAVDPNEIDAGEIAIGLRRKPSDGACFFDVWNFFWSPGCN